MSTLIEGRIYAVLEGGHKMNTRNKWTMEEVTFLKENHKEYSQEELAKLLNRSVKAVVDKYYLLGLNLEHGLKKSESDNHHNRIKSDMVREARKKKLQKEMTILSEEIIEIEDELARLNKEFDKLLIEYEDQR